MAGFMVHDKTWPFTKNYLHEVSAVDKVMNEYRNLVCWAWPNRESQLGDLKYMHFTVRKGVTDIC